VWIDHVTNGKGRQKGSKLVVILWDRLNNFVSSEQHHIENLQNHYHLKDLPVREIVLMRDMPMKDTLRRTLAIKGCNPLSNVQILVVSW